MGLALNDLGNCSDADENLGDEIDWIDPEFSKEKF